MKPARYYTLYRKAQQASIDGKARIKTLWKEAKQAAEQALQKTTEETFDTRLAAIRAAWEPYRALIEEEEQEVARQQRLADRHFDAWQGLNQEEKKKEGTQK